MTQTYFDVSKYIEKHAEEFSYYGSFEEISNDLHISLIKVKEAVDVMVLNGDARLYKFTDGFFLMRLLPFADCPSFRNQLC